MRFLIMTANWFAKTYMGTPAVLRWIFWVVPLLYLLFPLDGDMMGPFGRIDDLLLIIFVFWAIDRTDRLRTFFDDVKTRKKQKKKDPHRAETRPRDPHEVLGVARGAGRSEIKKAYRKLIGMYHPDKFSHLGAEFEAEAQRRTREIIEAYETLHRAA